MTFTDRLKKAHLTRAELHSLNFYGTVASIIVMLLGTIELMRQINIHGISLGWNLVFAVVVMATFFILSFAPRPLLFSGIVGMVADAIEGKGIVRDAVGGMVIFARGVVVGIALWYGVLALFLMTWRMESGGEAFWTAAFAGLIIFLCYLWWNVEIGHMVRRTIQIYALGVVLFAIWGTFAPNTRDKVVDALPLSEYGECLADKTKTRADCAREAAVQKQNHQTHETAPGRIFYGEVLAPADGWSKVVKVKLGQHAEFGNASQHGKIRVQYQIPGTKKWATYHSGTTPEGTTLRFKSLTGEAETVEYTLSAL